MARSIGTSTKSHRSPLFFILFAAVLSLDGCAGLGDFIVQALEGLGRQPTVQVRIAGTNYIEFDKKDSGDGFTPKDGYLCVVHNPGCGIKGNDGEDKFFAPSKPLPLLAKLVKVEFVPYWPNGLGSGGGGIGGWGSYSVDKRGWPQDPDPSQTVYVDWNNACQGTFAGKNVNYSVSFLVSMPAGTDLGETTFDPTAQTNSPCQPAGSTPNAQPPTQAVPAPSGFLGVVKLCNPTTTNVSGRLHLDGTCSAALPGAQGICTMNEDTATLNFPPGGSAGSVASFSTALKYQQGTWKITNAKVTEQTTGQLLASLPGLPITLQLPGSVGSPFLDFTGGRCL
jgi:hypothetical protein